MKILDIGASNGWWYHQVKNKYQNAEFVLIDANPHNEIHLQKLGLSYYITCLSDSVKPVTFYVNINDLTSTGASYYLENTEFFAKENRIEIHMETTTLDLLFPNETFDLIKMDTQGSEIDIINGGLNLVKRAKELIIEVPNEGIVYNIGAPSRDEYFTAIQNLGFVNYEVLEDINGKQQDIKFTKG